LNKIRFIGIVLALICIFCGMSYAKDASIVALSPHELGDQTLAINAGLMIPLPFLELNGISSPNQSVGAGGSLQFNSYLNSFFRIGLEVGIGFTFGPDFTTFLMVPITFKSTYVMNFDRFELPLSLGIGTNIVKYGPENILDFTLILKPSAALYYRYDSNLSFGLNLDWWISTEFPAVDYPNTIIGNMLVLSPSLFYHF